TPAVRQTALFSATIPDEVRGLAHRQMRNPVTIAITPERPTVDLIVQRIEPVPDGDKLTALTAHLDSPRCPLALVFRRTTHKADRLAHGLTRRGYRVAVLHRRRTQGPTRRGTAHGARIHTARFHTDGPASSSSCKRAAHAPRTARTGAACRGTRRTGNYRCNATITAPSPSTLVVGAATGRKCILARSAA